MLAPPSEAGISSIREHFGTDRKVTRCFVTLMLVHTLCINCITESFACLPRAPICTEPGGLALHKIYSDNFEPTCGLECARTGAANFHN